MAETTELTRVHPQCPALRALMHRIENAQGCSEEAINDYKKDYIAKAQRLDELAAVIGRHVNELPCVSVEVPPQMGADWMEFATYCPVFANHKSEILATKASGEEING